MEVGGTESALRLLIVDDSVEAAEAIVSGLRNNGIAVRPARPENEAELGELLNDKTFELVLAAHGSQTVSVDKVMHLVSSTGKDLPVLLVVNSVDDSRLLVALEIGARGVVLRGHMEHIQSTVRAEWTDLTARRLLRRLEAQVREGDRRCDALIESSRDPIAYVHEGMHIRANAAYLEMFGFDSFEDIEGMSLLDMIAPHHVDGFKQLLKQMSKGEAAPPRYEVEARTLDGQSFAAVMEFTAATYEGENCLQLVLRRQEQEFDPELAREVEELRQRDQVTGLLNRATFLRALEDSVSESALKST
ncbi:MAG: PAS domain S-box protein, partial [Lysobacter sp.]